MIRVCTTDKFNSHITLLSAYNPTEGTISTWYEVIGFPVFCWEPTLIWCTTYCQAEAGHQVSLSLFSIWQHHLSDTHLKTLFLNRIEFTCFRIRHPTTGTLHLFWGVETCNIFWFLSLLWKMSISIEVIFTN